LTLVSMAVFWILTGKEGRHLCAWHDSMPDSVDLDPCPWPENGRGPRWAVMTMFVSVALLGYKENKPKI
jgi:hypothetical protein